MSIDNNYCTAFFEDLEHANSNSSLLDNDFKCRSCGRFAASHTRRPIIPMTADVAKYNEFTPRRELKSATSTTRSIIDSGNNSNNNGNSGRKSNFETLQESKLPHESTANSRTSDFSSGNKAKNSLVSAFVRVLNSFRQ